MTLIRCPECEKSISETADSCPHCGWRLTPEQVLQIKERQAKEKNLAVGCLVIGALVVSVIVIGALVAGNSSDAGSPKPNSSVTGVPFETAYRSCLDLTKSHVTYPSSFDDKWTYKNEGLYNTAGIVLVRFSVRNAFGMEIEGKSTCKIIENDQLWLDNVTLEDGTQFINH